MTDVERSPTPGDPAREAPFAGWLREQFAVIGEPVSVLVIRPHTMPDDPVSRIAALADDLDVTLGRVGIGRDLVVVLPGTSVAKAFDLLDAWHLTEVRRRRAPGAATAWEAQETADEVVGRCVAALANAPRGAGVLARVAPQGPTA